MVFFPLGAKSGTGSGRNTPTQHNRSASLGTVNIPVEPSSSSPHSSKWRPSVLGIFASSATSQTSVLPSETLYTPSRPSISSSYTCTSSAATPPSRLEVQSVSPSKPSFVDSLRSRRKSYGNLLYSATPKPGVENVLSTTSLCTNETVGSVNSSSSVQKQKSNARVPFAPKPVYNRMNSADDDDDEDDGTATRARRVTVPAVTQPQVVFSAPRDGGTLSRVGLSGVNSRSEKKKKKLIISGIGPGEAKKFEAAKRWCEVSSLLRVSRSRSHSSVRRLLVMSVRLRGCRMGICTSIFGVRTLLILSVIPLVLK